jgi:hypothetical protein
MRNKRSVQLIVAILTVIVFLPSFVLSQTRSPRILPAKRTTQRVRIDGLLTDSAWKDAAMMTDLVEFRPKIGDREAYGNRTEAWLMYDDEGIYFGGYCHEKTKDSIATDLVGRDGFGTNDYVGIIFDTYNDRLNAFEYFVTPLNEQWDAKMSPPPTPNSNSEDFTWNSVWQSGAVIHSDGWSFEMFIPYSAIRFGKKDIQTWGFNITRRRRKTEEQFTWNPIDPNVNGFLTQEGLWDGISHIKPPLRLQFSPYFSVYANHYPYNVPGVNNWTGQVNGGMDVKYGINQAFTLDVTLIPDFGQVQSDNRVLNLTPYEVKYVDNRPFFMEGTELFNKGNLFYSKRIGTYPAYLHDPDAGAGEQVIKYPQESKLINAFKVSGRTQKGLGIGFLNAITNSRYATIEDTSTHQTRKSLVDPLSNYNIFVLDQTLKNNSSISFVNTSVIRSGSDYDANVSAGLFDFNDKTNTWNAGGKVSISNLIDYLPNGKTQTGYSHSLYFGKTSGNFVFKATQDLADDKYTSNDFGYFTLKNFLDHSLWMQYHWLKPTGWYNNFRINVNAYYSRLSTSIPYADSPYFKLPMYRNANLNINANSQLKSLWFVGALVGYEPDNNNFDEPHSEGHYFRGWADWFVDAWVQSNESKRYNVYTELLYVRRNMFKSKRYLLTFQEQFRFNKKFSIVHSLSAEPQTDNVGYATFDASDNKIIFGRRDRNTIENILTFKFNFNDKMGISTRVRHYWSKVDYKEFFNLMPDGGLQSNSSFNQNENQNVNYFNIDMTYTWQFAPGSFLNIVWKNAVTDVTDQVENKYVKNVDSTMDADQNNNFSLKVIYFLDYLSLKKKKKS